MDPHGYFVIGRDPIREVYRLCEAKPGRVPEQILKYMHETADDECCPECRQYVQNELASFE